MRRSSSALYCFGVAGDCLEVGAGGLDGFGTALSSVAEGAKGHLVAGGDAGRAVHVGVGQGKEAVVFAGVGGGAMQGPATPWKSRDREMVLA